MVLHKNLDDYLTSGECLSKGKDDFVSNSRG